MNAVRSFAIVPAAGHSTRMGRPKLLLPWRGSTIIEQVVETWLASNVTHVVMVLRRQDHELAAACERFAVELVRPAVDPRDMKESVQYGLRRIEQKYAAADPGVWLLAPADLPRLSVGSINRVLAAHDMANEAIVVPQVEGRRGHPVLFPWQFSRHVFNLKDDQGVNHLLTGHPVRHISLDDAGCLEDIDSPADYQRVISADKPT